MRVLIAVGEDVFRQPAGSDGCIARLIKGIGELKRNGNEVLVVSAGADALGVGQGDLGTEFQVRHTRSNATAARLRYQLRTAVGQALLAKRYVDESTDQGELVAQIVVTRADLADQGRYESLRVATMNLLTLGILPIFSENSILTWRESQESGAEQLGCILATALQADVFVILAGPNAIYDGHSIVSIEELSARLGASDDGGLREKMQAATMVTSFGIEAWILNATADHVLSHALVEEKPSGTRFAARGRRLRRHKSWVALASLSKGDLVVSCFLADSLTAGKPASILLLGIEQVTGTFSKGDVVTVKDTEGRVLGRGEVRLDSSAILEHIQSRVSGTDLAAVYGAEVIHCDYFVPTPSTPTVRARGEF